MRYSQLKMRRFAWQGQYVAVSPCHKQKEGRFNDSRFWQGQSCIPENLNSQCHRHSCIKSSAVGKRICLSYWRICISVPVCKVLYILPGHSRKYDGNAEHKVSLDISIQEISAGYYGSAGTTLFKQNEIRHCPAAVIHP